MWTFLSALQKIIVNESFSSWLATKSRAAITSVCCVLVERIGFLQTPRRGRFSISLFNGPQDRKLRSPERRRSWCPLFRVRVAPEIVPWPFKWQFNCEEQKQ